MPNEEKAQELCKWINGAVDTAMMRKLREEYPQYKEHLPATVEKVDTKEKYFKIQEIVRQFILEKRNNTITPVQFDDIYWYKEKQKQKALHLHE